MRHPGPKSTSRDRIDPFGGRGLPDRMRPAIFDGLQDHLRGHRIGTDDLAETIAASYTRENGKLFRRGANILEYEKLATKSWLRMALSAFSRQHPGFEVVRDEVFEGSRTLRIDDHGSMKVIHWETNSEDAGAGTLCRVSDGSDAKHILFLPKRPQKGRITNLGNGGSIKAIEESCGTRPLICLVSFSDGPAPAIALYDEVIVDKLIHTGYPGSCHEAARILKEKDETEKKAPEAKMVSASRGGKRERPEAKKVEKSACGESYEMVDHELFLPISEMFKADRCTMRELIEWTIMNGFPESEWRIEPSRMYGAFLEAFARFGLWRFERSNPGLFRLNKTAGGCLDAGRTYMSKKGWGITFRDAYGQEYSEVDILGAYRRDSMEDPVVFEVTCKPRHSRMGKRRMALREMLWVDPVFCILRNGDGPLSISSNSLLGVHRTIYLGERTYLRSLARMLLQEEPHSPWMPRRPIYEMLQQPGPVSDIPETSRALRIAQGTLRRILGLLRIDGTLDMDGDRFVLTERGSELADIARDDDLMGRIRDAMTRQKPSLRGAFRSYMRSMDPPWTW